MFGDRIFSSDRSLSLSIICVCEKIEENLCCGSLNLFNFSALASSNSGVTVVAQCLQKTILEVEFN